MKTYLLSLVGALSFFIAVGQESETDFDPREDGKNEININLAYIIAKGIELNYERSLNEDFSVGIAGSYWFEKSMSWSYNSLLFARLYPLGKIPNWGLFVELNAGIFDSEKDIYYEQQHSVPGYYNGYYDTEESIGFGMGVAVGGKFITKRGVTMNIYGGLMRNFIEDQYPEVLPRLGVSIGKRF